jgi:hypothetical protein
MREAVGSRAGGAVVVLSDPDPRQVTLLLLGPFSTPYGEWGWWQVAGWPADPSSHTLQKKEGGKRWWWDHSWEMRPDPTTGWRERELHISGLLWVLSLQGYFCLDIVTSKFNYVNLQ